MVIVSYLDDLRAFNWWGNAKPVAKKLTQSHRWNEVEVLLEDVQIMTDTALNEYLAYEVPEILNLGGINNVR